MRVSCKVNNVRDLDDDVLVGMLRKKIFTSDGSVDVEVNVDYVVYGIEFWDNAPWYYLCSCADDEYPKPYPADFFSVIDMRLSKFWELSSGMGCHGERVTSLVFREWSQDRTFFERLVDGGRAEVEVFEKYRALMNAE